MMTIKKSSYYKKSYGAWAGLPNGHAPNYDLCCEEVADSGNIPLYHQCSKKRGHGPDNAYCKQHDPVVAKARRYAAMAREKDRWNKKRYEWNGPVFYDALVKIAEGHNDPRGLAQDVIAEFKKGEQ